MCNGLINEILVTQFESPGLHVLNSYAPDNPVKLIIFDQVVVKPLHILDGTNHKCEEDCRIMDFMHVWTSSCMTAVLCSVLMDVGASKRAL